MTEKKDYPLARAYLGRVQNAQKKVDWLRQQAANLRMLTTDTSVHYTSMPHSDSPDQQKLLTILAEIDELERQIPAAESAVSAIRLEVGETICRIPDHTIQGLLRDRYLEGKSWKEISKGLGYQISQTYLLHRQGLASLEKLKTS